MPRSPSRALLRAACTRWRPLADASVRGASPRFETVLRPTWRLASVKGGTAKLAAHYETLSFERQAPALLRAVQLGLPVQRCQGGSALKLQRLIDLVKVAVPAMGDPRFWTPWAMPLAVLLSAAAVGEPLRPAKAGTHSEHRCQARRAVQLFAGRPDTPRCRVSAHVRSACRGPGG